MRYTAIIHLEDPPGRTDWPSLRATLESLPGVESVVCEPVDGLVVVRFEEGRANLAHLVRRLEDLDVRVSGVAQRPLPTVTVPRRAGASIGNG